MSLPYRHCSLTVSHAPKGFIREIIIMWLVILLMFGLFFIVKLLFMKNDDAKDITLEKAMVKSEEQPTNSLLVKGAGSTLVAPLYSMLLEHAIAEQKLSMSFKYSPTNLEDGIGQLKDERVGWISMERPFSSYERISLGVFQLPIMIAALGVAVNLPEMENNTLKLSRSNLADIYLGHIVRWNDPRLVRNNPNIKLPDLPIKVFYRNGESGITFALSSYLSSISSEWKEKIGVDSNINWPIGIPIEYGADIDHLKSIDGSLICLESSYLAQSDLRLCAMENMAGNYIVPSRESLEAVIPLLDENIFYDYTEVLTKLPGKDCYPLVAMNYSAFLFDPKTQRTSMDLAGYWDLTFWAFKQNDFSKAHGFHSVFLPERFIQKIRDTFHSVQYSSRSTRNQP